VTLLRRLDHVAVVVRNTEAALDYFSGTLGLRVASTEEIESPRVRLTYLDAGNVYLQLVEPLNGDSEVARWLDEHGEGLHHVCFGVDDVPSAVEALSGEAPVSLGSGRGRVSAFVPSTDSHGVRVECTEFLPAEDVEQTPGYLG
jgi:methylmalonyl-CoA/ethylmalonyl-CoA epimerase